jgi:N-glycosidase YbiA
MKEEITKFDGVYGFLSNFYPAEITYGHLTGRTLEHVYQASKAKFSPTARTILDCETATQAKRKGGKVVQRDEWNDEFKLRVMHDLLRLKFAIPELRRQLLATGEAWIVHGNTHNDVYWGVCKGKGKNHLGVLLMIVRNEIRKAEPLQFPPRGRVPSDWLGREA